MNDERFYLSQDGAGDDWYVIPVSKKQDWNKFCEIPEDDEASWDIPEWAVKVGGCTSLVTFPSFEIE